MDRIPGVILAMKAGFAGGLKIRHLSRTIIPSAHAHLL